MPKTKERNVTKNLKVGVYNSGSMEKIATLLSNEQHCEHKVGHVLYRVYFTNDGMSIHAESDDKIPNAEYQMQLSPHGSNTHGMRQAVDITCKRTDK